MHALPMVLSQLTGISNREGYSLEEVGPLF